MTPEQEKQLSEALDLARENNNLLRKMRKSMVWARVFRFIYFAIIIGLSLGAYYFVQPYLEGVLDTYSSLLEGAEDVQEVSNSLPDLGSLLDRLSN